MKRSFRWLAGLLLCVGAIWATGCEDEKTPPAEALVSIGKIDACELIPRDELEKILGGRVTMVAGVQKPGVKGSTAVSNCSFKPASRTSDEPAAAAMDVEILKSPFDTNDKNSPRKVNDDISVGGGHDVPNLGTTAYWYRLRPAFKGTFVLYVFRDPGLTIKITFPSLPDDKAALEKGQAVAELLLKKL